MWFHHYSVPLSSHPTHAGKRIHAYVPEYSTDSAIERLRRDDPDPLWRKGDAVYHGGHYVDAAAHRCKPRNRIVFWTAA